MSAHISKIDSSLFGWSTLTQVGERGKLKRHRNEKIGKNCVVSEAK
mgnify:CR=1 FL=1